MLTRKLLWDFLIFSHLFCAGGLTHLRITQLIRKWKGNHRLVLKALICLPAASFWSTVTINFFFSFIIINWFNHFKNEELSLMQWMKLFNYNYVNHQWINMKVWCKESLLFENHRNPYSLLVTSFSSKVDWIRRALISYHELFSGNPTQILVSCKIWILAF